MVNERQKRQLAKKRAQRVRGKMHGTAQRPRLSIFRSNRFTYAQVIDDDKGQTLVAANDKMLTKTAAKGTKLEKAKAIAEKIAAELKKLEITKISFDRGSYRYHGRLRMIADTLREAGIEV